MSTKLHIYSRSDWNARHPRDMDPQAHPLEAFLHHSDDPTGREYRTLVDQRRKMRAIQDFHMDVRGYSDIAYAYIVFQYLGKTEPRIEPRVFAGRSTNFVPAAQLNHNTRTLPICVVGNGEREILDMETQRVIAALIKRYPSVRKLGGHRNVVSTTCPGGKFYAAVPNIARLAGVRTF